MSYADDSSQDHRYGAAAVAGFVLTCTLLKPSNLQVVAEIGVVRKLNRWDAPYLGEVVPAHSGIRVRVGNSASVGPLILADLLSHLRQRALNTSAQNKHIFSIGSLAGQGMLDIG